MFSLVCLCILFADVRSLSPGYFTLTYSRNLASGFVLFLFFFTSTLINYLAMKIPCLLFFLQQLVCFFQKNSLLYYSLFRLQFIVRLLLLSLFDIFDSILICFISFHLFLLCISICFLVFFKIVYHRSSSHFNLQKYSLTLIIESSRFLMSRLHVFFSMLSCLIH